MSCKQSFDEQASKAEVDLCLHLHLLCNYLLDSLYPFWISRDQNQILHLH